MRILLCTSIITAATLGCAARDIHGRVLAETDSTAMPGAACRLFQGERLIGGGQTDSLGRFGLDTDLRGQLRLEVGMTGYSTAEILIDSPDKKTDLGDIYLTDNAALAEVTVEGSATFDARGRTIVIPSLAEVKASSSMISLMQKLPLAGMLADPMNRTLTVDGGSPTILINGVPSTMDDVNALQPKEIAKIEYSRFTPARYADRGTSGFISITLKKRSDGGTVYAWGRSAVNTAFVDASVTASYHQGPSQFSLAYTPSWRNYQSVYDHSESAFAGPDFRVDLTNDDRNPFDYLLNFGNIKYVYSKEGTTLFSAKFSPDASSSHRRYIGSYEDSALGDYDERRWSRSRDFTPALDLFFRRDFNERNSLEAQMVGTLGYNEYHRDNRFIYPDGALRRYKTDIDSRRRSLITEVSYTHTFSDKTALSGGVQNTLSHSRNTYEESDYRPVLTENNNYIYARLGQQAGKFYFNISTGAKLFFVKNDMNKRAFIRNRSLVRVNYSINNQWSLEGAFSYSPVIPSLAALTDYPQQATPYLVSNGNPDLKIADYFVYQVYGSYSFKKLYIGAMASYWDTNNATFSDVSYLGDGLFLSRTVNARYSRAYEGSLSAKISDIAGFGISAAISYTRSENRIGDNIVNLNSVAGSINVWWNKGPYTVTYYRKFPGKYLSGYMVGKNENADILSFDYAPDKHWTVTAQWWYMFDKKGTRYPSWDYSPVNPSATTRHIADNGNMVVLSLSYNTDFGSIFRAGRRSLNNSDNGSAILKL